MDELSQKIDNILLLIRELNSDIQEIKERMGDVNKDSKKMSDHIDCVDFYVKMFDGHFRRQVETHPRMEIPDID